MEEELIKIREQLRPKYCKKKIGSICPDDWDDTKCKNCGYKKEGCDMKIGSTCEFGPNWLDNKKKAVGIPDGYEEGKCRKWKYGICTIRGPPKIKLRYSYDEEECRKCGYITPQYR